MHLDDKIEFNFKATYARALRCVWLEFWWNLVVANRCGKILKQIFVSKRSVRRTRISDDPRMLVISLVNIKKHFVLHEFQIGNAKAEDKIGQFILLMTWWRIGWFIGISLVWQLINWTALAGEFWTEWKIWQWTMEEINEMLKILHGVECTRRWYQKRFVVVFELNPRTNVPRVRTSKRKVQHATLLCLNGDYLL